MHKERKDKHFIKKPIYEGGKKALREFIRKNIKYPEAALEEKIEGTVVLNYTINYQGKVVDTKVISSLGHGCDEEAVRLVKLLKFKVPKSRGLKVQFHKNIQIHFRLPKQKASKQTKRAIQYQYTANSTKEKEDKKQQEDKRGYTYTINW